MAENQTVQPGRGFDVGILFRLEEGWHVYWVNAGDSGEPPRLEWRLEPGLKAGEIQWPTPRRLPIPPLVDYGYEGEVLLPVHIDNKLQAGSEAGLSADLRTIVCREVCIPGKASLSLSLPVETGTPKPSPGHDYFVRARAAMPKAVPPSWKISARDLGGEFELTIRGPRPDSAAWFAPLEAQQIENAAPQRMTTTAGSMHLILKKSDQLLQPISKLRGLLLVPSRGSYLVDVPVRRGAGNHQGAKR